MCWQYDQTWSPGHPPSPIILTNHPFSSFILHYLTPGASCPEITGRITWGLFCLRSWRNHQGISSHCPKESWVIQALPSLSTIPLPNSPPTSSPIPCQPLTLSLQSPIPSPKSLFSYHMALPTNLMLFSVKVEMRKDISWRSVHMIIDGTPTPKPTPWFLLERRRLFPAILVGLWSWSQRRLGSLQLRRGVMLWFPFFLSFPFALEQYMTLLHGSSSFLSLFVSIFTLLLHAICFTCAFHFLFCFIKCMDYAHWSMPLPHAFHSLCI